MSARPSEQQESTTYLAPTRPESSRPSSRRSEGMKAYLLGDIGRYREIWGDMGRCGGRSEGMRAYMQTKEPTKEKREMRKNSKDSLCSPG